MVLVLLNSIPRYRNIRYVLAPCACRKVSRLAHMVVRFGGAMAERTSQEFVRKANARSPVWDHFQVHEVEDGKVVCLHCKRSVAAHCGNTSNLISHLRSKHLKQYELAVSAKKPP